MGQMMQRAWRELSNSLILKAQWLPINPCPYPASLANDVSWRRDRPG